MDCTSLIIEPFNCPDQKAELHVTIVEKKCPKIHIVKSEGATLKFPGGISCDPAHLNYIKEFKMYAYDQGVGSGKFYQLWIPCDTLPDKNGSIIFKIKEHTPNPWFELQQTNKPKINTL